MSGQEGSDPASVVYDAIAAAKARNADVLLCDTAGRLHNKKNLMNELGKINRILEREYPEAFRETLVVLDGTTGQNALAQARQFKEVADITARDPGQIHRSRRVDRRSPEIQCRRVCECAVQFEAECIGQERRLCLH